MFSLKLRTHSHNREVRRFTSAYFSRQKSIDLHYPGRNSRQSDTGIKSNATGLTALM